MIMYTDLQFVYYGSMLCILKLSQLLVLRPELGPGSLGTTQMTNESHSFGFWLRHWFVLHLSSCNEIS